MMDLPWASILILQTIMKRFWVNLLNFAHLIQRMNYLNYSMILILLYCDSWFTIVFRMRYSGQRSLQAAVTSNALQVSNYKAQLDLILNPLIVTLSNTTNPADALAQRYIYTSWQFFLTDPYDLSNENADIRQSAISYETLNSHSIDILAAKTFALLFSKANGIALKQSLAPIFL